MKSRFAICLLALTALLAFRPDVSAQPAAQTAAITNGLHVFTCGHSFHAFFVAPIIKDIADGAGIKGHEILGISKIGGSRAIQHWDVPDDKNEAKKALLAGKADALTLSCMHAPDDGIDKFAALGFSNNPNFRVSLQEFWIPFDKMEWPFKGDQSLVDPNAATGPGLRALHEPYFKSIDERVVAVNARLGKQVVFVAPVGQAIIALREKIIAGQMPGIAKQSELFTDKLGHPQPPLQALVAYVHFAVLYRRTPVGLPLPAILKNAKRPQWNDQLNRVLQELAWDAVIHHPLSGVTGTVAQKSP